MTLARVRVAWQGWPGAPGVSTFYLDPGPSQAQINSIRSFFSQLTNFLPAGLTINVPSSGDEINESTGQLTGVWVVGTTPTVVTAAGTGTYAGNAGAVVHWLTDGISGKRRIRGRTFLVPLVNGAYGNDGAISPTSVQVITDAAQALVTSMPGLMNVWVRPIPGRTGLQSSITSVRVPRLSVSLRSRRI
jgi:hypothetical protein